ncbi:hypothetical protein [Nitratifractor sp.]
MNKKIYPLLFASVLALGGIQAQAGSAEAGQGKSHTMKGKQQKKRTAMKRVFLIQKGLPHYSMILKRFWDDPKLGLSEEQKTKLLAIRQELFPKRWRM